MGTSTKELRERANIQRGISPTPASAPRRDRSKAPLEQIRARLATYKKWAGQLEPYLEDAERRDLETALRQLERQQLTLVVVGEFDVGKSTFLNALLRRPLLVTDVRETTATVTFLCNAADHPDVDPERCRVHYADGTVRIFPHSHLRHVTTALEEGSQVAEDIERVEVFIEGGAIPRKATVVDSPGLNGLKPQHERITKRQIALSHAAIFLFSFDRGVGQKSEIDFIRELRHYTSNILFVVNKWDLVEKTMTREKYLEKHDASFRRAFGGEYESAMRQHRLWFVSAAKFLDEFSKPYKNGETPSPHVIEFIHLEREIGRLFERDARVRLQLLHPLRLMTELGDRAIGRLEKEHHHLEVNQFDAEIDAEREALQLQSTKSRKMLKTLGQMARQDGRAEAERCRKEIARSHKGSKVSIGRFIRALGDGDLLGKKIQETIRAEVRSEIENGVGARITGLLQAFTDHFVNDLLSQSNQSFVFSMATAGDYQIDRSHLSPVATRNIDADVKKVETRIEKIERVVKELREKKKTLMEEERAGKEAARKRTLEQKKLDALNKKRAALGPRPNPRVWFTSRTVEAQRDPDGFWETLASWVGKSYTKKRVVQDRHEDDSKGNKWRIKFDAVSHDIGVAESSIKRHTPVITRAETAIRELSILEVKIQTASTRLEEARNERERNEKRFRTENLLRQQKYLVDQWKSVVDSCLEHMSDSIEKHINDLIVGAEEAIEEGQSQVIDAYRKQLDAKEQERLTSNKELNRKKQHCLEGLERIPRLIAEMSAERKHLEKEGA